MNYGGQKEKLEDQLLGNEGRIQLGDDEGSAGKVTVEPGRVDGFKKQIVGKLSRAPCVHKASAPLGSSSLSV